jgi:predicted nucleic acid-binding protein
VTVFVDSSVWFAAVFAKDAGHARAIKILEDEAPALLTTDHIIVETWLLLKNRSNQAAAEEYCQRMMGGWCRIEAATYEDLQAAETIRSAFLDQKFSLVDRTSFVVMERLGLARVASFDKDFSIYRYGAHRDRAFEVLR